MSRPRLTYLTILLGALLWCGAILLAPVCAAAGGTPARVASFIYRFYQPICHQISDRSLHLLGGPIAVCIRCSAIYFAFLAATLFYPLVRSVSRPDIPARRWLVLSLLPMVLDVAAGAAGLHEITSLTRTISGALVGAVLPFYLIPAATEAVVGLSKPGAFLSPERKDL